MPLRGSKSAKPTPTQVTRSQTKHLRKPKNTTKARPVKKKQSVPVTDTDLIQSFQDDEEDEKEQEQKQQPSVRAQKAKREQEQVEENKKRTAALKKLDRERIDVQKTTVIDDDDGKQYEDDAPLNYAEEVTDLHVAFLDLEWVTHQAPLSRAEKEAGKVWKQRDPSKHISELCAVSADGQIVFNRYIWYKPLHPIWKQLQESTNILGKPLIQVAESDDKPKTVSFYECMLEWFKHFKQNTVFFYYGTKDASAVLQNMTMWPNPVERDDMIQQFKERQFHLIPARSILRKLFKDSNLKYRYSGAKLTTLYNYMFFKSLLTKPSAQHGRDFGGNWKVDEFVGWFLKDQFSADDLKWLYESERYGKYAVPNDDNREHEQIQFFRTQQPEFHTAHTDTHVLRHCMIAACMYAQLYHRLVSIVKPYYDLEQTLYRERMARQTDPEDQTPDYDALPMKLDDFVFACFMTALGRHLRHLRHYFLRISQQADMYLRYHAKLKVKEFERKAAKIAKKQRDTQERKDNPDAMPDLEQYDGSGNLRTAKQVEAKTERQRAKERIAVQELENESPFADLKALPWGRSVSGKQNKAIRQQLSNDWYDEETGQLIIGDTITGTVSRLVEQVTEMQTDWLQVFKHPIPDVPCWIATNAKQRRVKPALVLHCYHCPSIHNAEVRYLKLSPPWQIELPSLVFCAVCKKFDGLSDMEQNAEHEHTIGTTRSSDPDSIVLAPPRRRRGGRRAPPGEYGFEFSEAAAQTMMPESSWMAFVGDIGYLLLEQQEKKRDELARPVLSLVLLYACLLKCPQR